MSNIATTRGAAVPANIAKMFGLQSVADFAGDLSGGVNRGYPVLRIKGKTWKISQGGVEEIIMRPGTDDEPASALEVVILKANKNISKVWYANGYAEGSDAKPDCFSNDGIEADASVLNPPVASRKCAVCPNNAWGSKISEQGSKGKACADSRRIAVANPDDLKNPMLLRVPAASLKPLAQYGDSLANRGVPYFAVITRMGFDPAAAFPSITFRLSGVVTEEQAPAILEALAAPVLEDIMGARPSAAAAPAVSAAQVPAALMQAAAQAPAPAATPAPAPAKAVRRAAAPAPAPVQEAAPAAAPAPAKEATAPVMVAKDDGDFDSKLDALLGGLGD